MFVIWPGKKGGRLPSKHRPYAEGTVIILQFDYTVSSRKLQQHRRRETLKNQEVEKVKGKILEIIESISNLEQLRAIYNFAVYILTK